MKEKLSPAVEVLYEKLQEQQTAVATTKKLINQLTVMMGEAAPFPDVEPESVVGVTRPDQYYGKAPTVAAEEYLKRRAQACSIEDIQKGLEQGGFDFESMGWKAKDYVRMLAITLAKNPQKFHKLPSNAIGLTEWYPNVVVNKRTEKVSPAESLPVQSQDDSHPRNTNE